MAKQDSSPPFRPIADNSGAWPALARLLAPAAGCECQMLALSMAERSAARPAERDEPAGH